LRPVQMAEQVPGATYEGFDYVALGHLHRPQQVADRIAYSGSPIPYSFSEVPRATPNAAATAAAGDGAAKSVTLVEIAPDGAVTTERRPTPVWKPIARIEGELESLLTDPAYAPFTEYWLEVTLTDRARPAAPMDRLRGRFPGVLSLRFAHDPAAAASADSAGRLERLAERDPYDLAAEFVEHVRGNAPDPDEQALLHEALTRQAAREQAG